MDTHPSGRTGTGRDRNNCKARTGPAVIAVPAIGPITQSRARNDLTEASSSSSRKQLGSG